MKRFNFFKWIKSLKSKVEDGDYLPHISLLFLFIILDQYLKKMALQWLPSYETESFLNFSFSKSFNRDFLLNLEMKTLDFLLESIIYIFLIPTIYFLFIFALKLIPKKMPVFKLGATLIGAGALSNIYDKVQTKYVLDFIHFKVSNFFDVFFNFADIFQTVGWIIVLILCFKHRKIIWRNVENRKTFFNEVFKKDQMEFIFFVLMILACTGITFFLLFQELLLIVAQENQALLQQMKLSMKYYFTIYVIFSFILMIWTVYFSNKIYGPIYAFHKYVKNLLNKKKTSDLKLRRKDQFKKELEDLSLEIKKSLK